jgi:hypothetical protein
MLPGTEQQHQHGLPFPIGGLSCPLPYTTRTRTPIKAQSNYLLRIYENGFECFINRAVAYRLLELSSRFPFYKIKTELSMFGMDETYKDVLSDARKAYKKRRWERIRVILIGWYGEFGTQNTLCTLPFELIQQIVRCTVWF